MWFHSFSFSFVFTLLNLPSLCIPTLTPTHNRTYTPTTHLFPPPSPSPSTPPPHHSDTQDPYTTTTQPHPSLPNQLHLLSKEQAPKEQAPKEQAPKEQAPVEFPEERLAFALVDGRGGVLAVRGKRIVDTRPTRPMWGFLSGPECVATAIAGGGRVAAGGNGGRVRVWRCGYGVCGYGVCVVEMCVVEEVLVFI